MIAVALLLLLGLQLYQEHRLHRLEETARNVLSPRPNWD